MREAIAATQRACPGAPIRISAQAHLQRFYGSLGFVTASDEYDEDGIAHVDMLLSRPAAGAAATATTAPS